MIFPNIWENNVPNHQSDTLSTLQLLFTLSILFPLIPRGESEDIVLNVPVLIAPSCKIGGKKPHQSSTTE